ncbi:hypothetical protein [Arthrobacter sp. Z4-13]
MIPYRPVAPLTAEPRKGWKPVIAAIVMAALLGTTATAAVAAEPELHASSLQSVSTINPELPAIEPVRRES